jgi:multiple sugar transport system permease protein/sn-glycerol 3-phosphate transport system permease protein
MRISQPVTAWPASSHHKRSWAVRIRHGLGRGGIYATMWLGAVIFLIPMAFMVSTSLKTMDQVFIWPIQWIPQPPQWANYELVFKEAPFFRYILNTLIITVFGIMGNLISSALVAYPFARMRFPGRNTLFMVLLATMMVPGWVTLIPTYILFKWFGWVDTFLPLIVPAFVANPFYTFLLRQYMMTIPFELEDAAKIDGANSFRIWWQILLPLCKPALGTVAIFAFFYHWNEFLTPLIYLNSQSKFTLAVGIASFQGEFTTQFPLLMAASIMALIPPVMVFFFTQKLFVQGVVMSGLKG